MRWICNVLVEEWVFAVLKVCGYLNNRILLTAL